MGDGCALWGHDEQRLLRRPAADATQLGCASAHARAHGTGGLEVVRVQSGTMYLAFGEDLSREASVAYGPGSFIVHPAGTTSRMFTGDEEVVVEVTHLPIG